MMSCRTQGGNSVLLSVHPSIHPSICRSVSLLLSTCFGAPDAVNTALFSDFLFDLKSPLLYGHSNMNALHYIERFMYDALLPIRTDLRKASLPFLHEADSLERTIFFGKKLRSVLICKNLAVVSEKG